MVRWLQLVGWLDIERQENVNRNCCEDSIGTQKKVALIPCKQHACAGHCTFWVLKLRGIGKGLWVLGWFKSLKPLSCCCEKILKLLEFSDQPRVSSNMVFLWMTDNMSQPICWRSFKIMGIAHQTCFVRYDWDFQDSEFRHLALLPNA